MEALSMEPLDSYWHDILGVVRRLVHQQTYDTWFLPLEPLAGIQDFKVSVPT